MIVVLEQALSILKIKEKQFNKMDEFDLQDALYEVQDQLESEEEIMLANEAYDYLREIKLRIKSEDIEEEVLNSVQIDIDFLPAPDIQTFDLKLSGKLGDMRTLFSPLDKFFDVPAPSERNTILSADDYILTPNMLKPKRDFYGVFQDGRVYILRCV